MLEEFQEILQGTKEELPLLREINHKVRLIDPDQGYQLIGLILPYKIKSCRIVLAYSL